MITITFIIALAALIIAIMAFLKKGKDPQTEKNTKAIADNKKAISNNKRDIKTNANKIEEVDVTTPKAIEKTNGNVLLIFNGKNIYNTETKKKK